MKIDSLNTTSFAADNMGNSETGLSESKISDSPKSLSSPFVNPYKKFSSFPTSTSSTGQKGKTAAERNNNPFNIKFGNFATKYGATKENKNALDGGSFATFSSPEVGFKAAKDLLLGKNYRNLTVDQAMKRWSNNGYGGNIFPQIANKKVADLNPNELENLQKKQIIREDRNYASKLGIFKYGGRIPKYNTGALLNPHPYNYTNPLGARLNNYTNPAVQNASVNANYQQTVNAQKNGFVPVSQNSGTGLQAGIAAAGIIGAGIEAFDDNPRKINKVASVGGSTLKGAATGAGIGSIIPGWGTAVGAVVGAGVGAGTAIIKNKKRQKQINAANQNDIQNFDTMQQQRSANLYRQLSPYQYKFGGEIKKDNTNIRKLFNTLAYTENYSGKNNAPDLNNSPNIKKVKELQQKENNRKLEKTRGYSTGTGEATPVYPEVALFPGSPVIKGLGKIGNLALDVVNPLSGLRRNPNSYYRVVGEDAVEDLVTSGLVRSKGARPKIVSEGINLGNRPTAFPSFSKGKISMEYAKGLDKHAIIKTDRAMAASTMGRHGKGSTMFPVDENGKYLNSFPASEATVYKPHWLTGYKKLPKYKFGGKIYEAEKNEVIQGTPVLEDSKAITPNLHLVKGNTHENGGTLGIGGDRVFSNSISFNGQSPAKIALKIGNQLKKFDPDLSSPDRMKKLTAERMTTKLNKELDTIFDVQESYMGRTQYKFGGTIYKDGGKLDGHADEKELAQLKRYLIENKHDSGDSRQAARNRIKVLEARKPEARKQVAQQTKETWDTLSKSNKSKLGIPITSNFFVGNNLDEVIIKGKKSTTKQGIGKNTAKNTKKLSPIKINSNVEPTPTHQPPVNSIPARLEKPETIPTMQPKVNSSGEVTTSTTNNKFKIDPSVAAGLGLSTLGYINTANNIRRMNTDVPVNLTDSPYYGYKDRSRLARTELQGVANTVLRDPNVNARDKQALFSRYSQGLNQINSQENSNRFQYDNQYAGQAMEISARNNAMLTQAQQQRIANENAKIGLKSENFNNYLGGVNTVLQEQERKKLDKEKFSLIADAYKRRYNTNFDIEFPQ